MMTATRYSGDKGKYQGRLTHSLDSVISEKYCRDFETVIITKLIFVSYTVLVY